MGKGKEHDLCKKSAVRRWGRGRNTFCVRNKRERNPGSCNRDFQRVFNREGLGLGFMLELNLEEVGWWN